MAAHWPLPAPGDIVWCRFPELPRQSPGPKPRPALVLEVIEREDGIEIAVVYGTSQRVDKLSAGEFAITRPGHAAAYKAARDGGKKTHSGATGTPASQSRKNGGRKSARLGPGTFGA